MKKAHFITRLARLWRLLGWLVRVMVQFRRLDGAGLPERERVLREAAWRGLGILGVRVLHNAPENPRSETGVLLVANHVSWLDIMVVCALYPCGFIAMKELIRWPIIGRMVANAGTVFIDRANRKDIEPVNIAIAQALNRGENVCFYPEARTSLGDDVLPLKAALFQSAINARAPIHPLALRYYDGEKRTQAVSFADINLFHSLWKIVSIQEITVRVNDDGSWLPEEGLDRFAIKDKVEHWLRAIVPHDAAH